MAKKKPAPKGMWEYINKDPFYKKCIHENVMALDIQREHALYNGRGKIEEVFAIVPVRQRYNYNPSGEHKGFHQWVALLRLELAAFEYKHRIFDKYPKRDFIAERLQIEQRFDFDLRDYPELQRRLYFYQIEATSP